MEVQYATLQDVSSICALIEKNKANFPFYQHSVIHEQVSAYIDASLILLAKEEETLLGFLAFHDVRKEIDMLCMETRNHQKEIIKALVDQMLTRFQSSSQIKMNLFDADQHMHQLVQEVGFVQHDRLIQNKKIGYRYHLSF